MSANNLRFAVDRKEFEKALHSVTLKGKYKSANSSKISSISNGVAGCVSDDGTTLTLGNASDTMAAVCSVPITDLQWFSTTKQSVFFFEVEMTIKYLKTFRDDSIHIALSNSKLYILTPLRKASVPLLVEHNGIAAITKVMSMDIPTDGTLPTFGRTTFESRIVLNGNVLAQAIKDCSNVGTATYKVNLMTFDSGFSFVISSVNFHETESYDIHVPFLSATGEDVTLEFSAPIDKFCVNTNMSIYLKDECPILLCGEDRKLIIAPYIRG